MYSGFPWCTLELVRRYAEIEKTYLRDKDLIDTQGLRANTVVQVGV